MGRDDSESGQGIATTAAAGVILAIALAALLAWGGTTGGVRTTLVRGQDPFCRAARDRTESCVVAYDLTGWVAVRTAREPTTAWQLEGFLDEAAWLMMAVVEPESWVENGGELAWCRLLGSTMYVDAPPRMHVEVRRVLRTLPTTSPALAESVRSCMPSR